jgi:hypothetical protein
MTWRATGRDMNIVRLKPLDWWQSCSGLCVICGTPMGIEMERKLVREKVETGESFAMTEDATEEEDAVLTGGGMDDLVQVCWFG